MGCSAAWSGPTILSHCVCCGRNSPAAAFGTWYPALRPEACPYGATSAHLRLQVCARQSRWSLASVRLSSASSRATMSRCSMLLCARLSASEGCVCGAVVDWNPAGVAIMSQYKWGGQCNSVEEDCEPLANLQWLAARHAQLADLPPEVCSAAVGCSPSVCSDAHSPAHAHLQDGACLCSTAHSAVISVAATVNDISADSCKVQYLHEMQKHIDHLTAEPLGNLTAVFELMTANCCAGHAASHKQGQGHDQVTDTSSFTAGSGRCARASCHASNRLQG